MKKAIDIPLGQSSAGSQISGTGSSSRGVELEGDSPELIAFVLLKNIVQIEQTKQNPGVFDAAWLLDHYAECLEAVQGRRTPAAPARKAR